ncbi:MAG: cytochrome c [Planctomycetes bacterium]|nr:cytochrome c [Planctomycetota bacterium]
MKHVLMIAFALGAVLFVAAGCGGGGKPAENKGGGGDSDKISRPEPTGDYKGKTNPTPDAVEEGKKLFETHCVTCHGPNGDGDSPVGSTLKPPASDLTDVKLQDAIGDDYIFWRISEGGKALNYDGMTPFKDSLKEEQRWQLVAYVRSLKK